jgi:hypothetical protein
MRFEIHLQNEHKFKTNKKKLFVNYKKGGKNAKR